MVYINIDMKDLLELRKEIEPKMENILKEASRDLAIQTHAHIVEEVQQKLHSTRDKYLQALHFEEVSEDVWIVSLDQKAMWIEEGMEEHEMIDDLLSSSKAKTAKNGSRFLSVPFQHNKGPTQQTQAQKDLTDTIKSHMSKQKMAYGKIETDANGKPKLGLIHKFDILKQPTKTHEGPGQGRGPIGSVRQGPTGIPFLQSVRVYQKRIQDGAGKEKTVKSIMTFRVASSKHKGTGRWVHPGLEAKNFFEEAHDWALRLWEEKIKDQIYKKVSDGL
jgi:hypothetical protein